MGTHWAQLGLALNPVWMQVCWTSCSSWPSGLATGYDAMAMVSIWNTAQLCKHLGDSACLLFANISLAKENHMAEQMSRAEKETQSAGERAEKLPG